MKLIEAYRFFVKHSGYVVGRRAIGAMNLARAEAYAKAAGYTVTWEPDFDADLGDHEAWCSAAKQGKCPGHEAQMAILCDASGKVRETLGGIIEADRDYHRVVEAEMALEAMPGNVQ